MLPIVSPHRFHRKAGRFFTRHQGLLIILGSLIIVATFIVKDVLRDQVKDVADSINAAENLYLIRDSNLELHEEIDEVDDNVSKGRIEVLRSLPTKQKDVDVIKKPEWSADFSRNSQRLLRIENEMGLEEDNLARLVLKAPPKPDHMTQFAELYKQWDTLRIKILEGDRDELNAKYFDSKAVYNRSVKTYSDVWLLSQRLHLIGSMILDDAHETKERNERLVNIFTPVSYGLFGLGALLTVLSKLFGVDSGAGSD